MLLEKRLSKISVIALVFMLMNICNYGQTSVQIPAKMDNTLYEDPTGILSNGAGTYIFAGRTGQTEYSIRRGLIAFDVADYIPANVNIQSVVLTLNMSKTASASQAISLHKVLAQWGEGTSHASRGEGTGDLATTSDATWTYRLYDTELWSTPGGDFESSASATLPVDNVGSYSWGSNDQLVADVQSWLDNPIQNFGWILIGDESVTRTAKRFDSRENSTESNQPVLTVTYTMEQETAMIDRFSVESGHLFVRDSVNGLPGPNEPIDFDKEPFVTKGLGPNGEYVSYYNFDVQPTEPAPIYVLFREGESMPVEGQMNIINVVPGDSAYNDFWEVQKVSVPMDYEANTAKSFQDVWDKGYPIEETTMLVNCPVVPEGSTARYRLNSNDTGLHEGWYKGQKVYYFNFSEKKLMTGENDMVPLSPIYVTFNINPDQEGGGPPSGFVTEPLSGRTHNIVATLPMDEGYSPLWTVNVYDNQDFWFVLDLMSAQSENILAYGLANVNCPIVELDSTAVSVGEEETVIPLKYELGQNYPNPFNPATKIVFSIPQISFVTLKVYDILGKEITTLVNERKSTGNYTVYFNASNLPRGVYFYRMQAGSFVSTKKFVLLK
jgi:hypothetical protein